MDDINRKKMNDIIIPHNEIARRPDNIPASYPKTEVSERIEKSSFFKKRQTEDSFSEKTTKSNKGLFLIIVGVVAFIGLGLMVANYFSSATISVVPFTQKASVRSEFTAVSESDKEDDALVFQFMSLVEEESKEIPATIEKKIQKKASGKVIIYKQRGKDLAIVNYPQTNMILAGEKPKVSN